MANDVSDLVLRALTQHREAWVVLDERTRIRFCNVRALELLGHRAAEVEGQPLQALIAGAPLPSRLDDGATPLIVETRAPDDAATRLLALSGSGFEGPKGRPYTLIRLEAATGRSPALQEPSDEEAFRQRLRSHGARALSSGRPAFLVLVGLQQLSLINQSYGQAVGDRVLRDLALRLAHGFPRAELTARLYGRKFAALLVDCGDEESVTAQVAAALEQIDADPVVTPVAEVVVDLRAGLVPLTDPSVDAERLIRCGLVALQQAKRFAGQRVVGYQPAMDEAVRRAIELPQALSRGLAEGQFRLYYQPKVNVTTGAIVGAEALVRWHHPERGVVPPVEFIGAAESCGLIFALGRWIFEECLGQIARWQSRRLPLVPVSINVSARQLKDGQLLDFVRECLSRHGVSPDRIEIELTESVLADEPWAVRETLAAFRALGIGIALDDFGTGYSSLSYIKRFPIDTVKIDRAFVQEIATSPSGVVILRSTIAMCRGLGMKLVAEGVETETEAAFLAQQGCPVIQGYLFSTPLDAEAFARRLVDRPRSLLPPRDDREVLLVLDDEPAILNAIRRALRDCAYRVLTTDSPAQALAWLAQQEVGLLITDQRMPTITGVEFLRGIKEAYPHTVRMVLSGFSDLETVTDAINEGSAFRFLAKPWDDQELKANIEDGFYYYRLQRQAQDSEAMLQQIQRSFRISEPPRRSGIEAIDADHLQLVQSHNALVDALFIRCDADGLVALYRRLVAVAERHFAAEEALMADSGYPEAPAHREDHRQVLARMRRYQEQMRAEETPVNLYGLLQFIKNWLENHHRQFDRALLAYLGASGEAGPPPAGTA